MLLLAISMLVVYVEIFLKCEIKSAGNQSKAGKYTGTDRVFFPLNWGADLVTLERWQ